MIHPSPAAPAMPPRKGRPAATRDTAAQTNLRHATQRQLRAFEAVARHLNFSRAAEELYLTQPAVSTLIRQLEGHAGLALFEQLGRQVYLTAAGVRLLEGAQAILALLAETQEDLAGMQGVAGGTLKVAVISAGDYFFPRLLVAFGDRHPGVNIQLSVFNREELLHQLGGNRVDLAVMVRPPGDIDTINESFAPHPYVIVAPPGHPLCTRRAIPIEVLLEQPFIMRERGSDTWNSMHEAFGRHFARVHTGLEVASTETIKQAVIAGMGLAFLSAHTIDAQRRLGELVVLDVAGFPARFDWFLVHRRNKRLPAAAQAFREFLLAEGAALIGRLFPDADPGAGKPRPARGRRA